jgi:hypothetical protein
LKYIYIYDKITKAQNTHVFGAGRRVQEIDGGKR